jgi:hypothetical protein
MTVHEQSWVKVNAQVDRGVVPLIEALNAFPELRTMESCETDGDDAWVCFDAGTENWNKLAEIVFGLLGPRLMDALGTQVRFEMTMSNGIVMAEMTVNKSVIEAASREIRDLASKARPG